MSDQHNASLPMKEQVQYAHILQIGVWLGLLILFVTYAIYVLGVLPAHVPVESVPRSWGLGVNEFMHSTGAPHGWNWLALLGTGDYINFVGLALLALVTIVCYAILIPGFAKRGDTIFVVICVLQILVLGVAASGILGAGGH